MEQRFDVAVSIFSAIVSFISFIGILLNLGALGVYHVYREERRRSYLNAFTIQFTMAGFLKSVLYFVFSITGAVYGTWKLGNTGCQCFSFLSTWFDAVEIYSVLIYGLMRVKVYIKKAIFRTLTRRRVSSIFHLLWMVSAIYAALPILCSVRYKVDLSKFSCSIDTKNENSSTEIIFFSILLVVNIVFPIFGCIYVLYGAIKYNSNVMGHNRTMMEKVFLWDIDLFVLVNMVFRLLNTIASSFAALQLQMPILTPLLSIIQSLILVFNPFHTWYHDSEFQSKIMELLGRRAHAQPELDEPNYGKIIPEKTLTHKFLKSLKKLVTDIQKEPVNSDLRLSFRKMYRVAYSVEGYPCLFQILQNDNEPCTPFVGRNPFRVMCRVTEKNSPSVRANKVNDILVQFRSIRYSQPLPESFSASINTDREYRGSGPPRRT